MARILHGAAALALIALAAASLLGVAATASERGAGPAADMPVQKCAPILCMLAIS